MKRFFENGALGRLPVSVAVGRDPRFSRPWNTGPTIGPAPPPGVARALAAGGRGHAAAGRHDLSRCRSTPRQQVVAVPPFADPSPEKDRTISPTGSPRRSSTRLQEPGAPGGRALPPSRSRGRTGHPRHRREARRPHGAGGSVRKAGTGSDHPAARDVADGYHLSSDRFDRQLEDVFEVQDKIPESIVKALRVVLKRRREARPERARPENVHLTITSKAGNPSISTEKSLQFARRMFQPAIEVDSNFARAYAASPTAARCLRLVGYRRGRPQIRPRARAKRPWSWRRAGRGARLSRLCPYPEQAVPGGGAGIRDRIHLDPTLFKAYYFYGGPPSSRKARGGRPAFEKSPRSVPKTSRPSVSAPRSSGPRRRDPANEARPRTVARAERHLEQSR